MCDGYDIHKKTLSQIIDDGMEERAMVEMMEWRKYLNEHYCQTINTLRTCIDAIMVVNRNRNKAITQLCEEARTQTDNLPWIERGADSATD